ncbi:FAD-dependent monooxygenase [Kinneretia asaccharophila]|uniref:2-octaprenyl-6-methoxyphenol hydroxylase n=1 Tax=Roseateles asaccharophilus TaxID=582607 RepID=A0A4R6NCL5_9BURK|nr:FAD-dependent monooxygenase [Roseateles asaccharophilus]MDN3542922.1 FAD-dependent monooxygenase [Roseateles asaccharophilus]TDP13378.1 2-octaprenyl-6-methoxyphenol hydroxylase [Roseateles asaccharophilus]
MPTASDPAAPLASRAPLRLAVVGAGPAGLTLALLAARSLPQAQITLFDARPLERDVSGDPRTLALALGSVQLLQRLGAWPGDVAQPIQEVHVSQAAPALRHPLFGAEGEPVVRLSARELGQPQLGAVLSYGQLVAPLQAAWQAAVAREPQRLISRFGQAVAAIKPMERGLEIDAGIVEAYDLAVVAEGGVFAEQSRKSLSHDYQQNAWVGTLTLAPDSPAGLAYERFTRNGPLALLPLTPREGQRRAALVWCMPQEEDEIATLSDAQRLTVIQSLLPERVGRLQGISPLKCFPLGLNAERSLVSGRTVRIGNAAQTLHPVAGQGLNLGLRDAYALVQALRDQADLDRALNSVEWQRAPDRWSMIATTDFLARSFAWRWPGLPIARGLGLAALQALPPLKNALARQMMFGRR